MEYYAHSRKGNPDKSTWQPLEEHLRKTAELASDFASAWRAGNWGYLAGLLHDLGKYSREFQQKISAAGGEDAHIESSARVDHSSAGAQYAGKYLGHAGKVLAYAIAGHHSGLPMAYPMNHASEVALRRKSLIGAAVRRISCREIRPSCQLLQLSSRQASSSACSSG